MLLKFLIHYAGNAQQFVNRLARTVDAWNPISVNVISDGQVLTVMYRVSAMVIPIVKTN